MFAGPQKDGPEGPWLRLEVGSAGCGRGPRCRVLGWKGGCWAGAGDRGSREHPGKSRGQGGGGARAGLGWAALRPGWEEAGARLAMAAAVPV